MMEEKMQSRLVSVRHVSMRAAELLGVEELPDASPGQSEHVSAYDNS